MSTVVLYCLCHSHGSSILTSFVFYFHIDIVLKQFLWPDFVTTGASVFYKHILFHVKFGSALVSVFANCDGSEHIRIVHSK